MVYLLKMVIFYSYVKLPEGTVSIQNLESRSQVGFPYVELESMSEHMVEPENCLVNPTFLLEAKCSEEHLYNNRSLI